MSYTQNKAPIIRTARDTVLNSSELLKISFLRVTDQLLHDALAADEKEIVALKQELTLTENARLHIHKQRGKNRFASFDRLTKRETYINRDIDRIHMLARRTYLEERLQTIQRRCRKMKTLLGKVESASEEHLHARLGRYQDVGLDLSRILFTKEQNEWIDEPYSPNPHYPERLKWSTSSNVVMRSKSEARLGRKAESLGLPYRYDDLVRIQHDPFEDMPYRDSYYADFKFPNLCGGITVHEHLGSLHLDKYPDNSLKRLNDYHNHTLIELPGRPVRHEEITWSFEHDLQTNESIRRLIQRILLPCER